MLNILLHVTGWIFNILIVVGCIGMLVSAFKAAFENPRCGFDKLTDEELIESLSQEDDNDKSK